MGGEDCWPIKKINLSDNSVIYLFYFIGLRSAQLDCMPQKSITTFYYLQYSSPKHKVNIDIKIVNTKPVVKFFQKYLILTHFDQLGLGHRYVLFHSELSVKFIYILQ